MEIIERIISANLLDTIVRPMISEAAISRSEYSFTSARSLSVDYECRITHLNNSREQKWTVSKTVCMQIIEQLKKGFTVLKVTRHGSDRNTTYTIEDMQK